MLTLLILIPLLGSLIILPMSDTLESHSQMKKIALTTSLINFFISLFICYHFDSSTSQYQFVSEFNQLNFCHLNFGIDGISLYFVLLTTFVTPIALLSNYTNITKSLKFFLISFLVLETLQICAFISLDLLLFYIFFESVLPILFIVIVIFGHGNDRFRSAFLFFLYTLAGSLPMLLCILLIYSYIGSTDFQLISLYEISLDSQKILWLGFFLAFAVKTPLYPFIIWLPKAHSDSPLAGSILLAATILKLATYGYLRVLINFLPDATNYFSPLIQTVAIISLIYASFSTIIQQDTKRLIAYSSVAHMAVVVLGLFSNNLQGIEGAILLAIGHGFTSPALFICVGGIIYDRTGTRIINYIRGLATYMPVFTILFFIFTLCNTGVPLSINWIGEQLSLMGIWQQNPIIACLGASGILLSACYSLFLYNRISYGNLSPYLPPLKDLNRREYYLLISLLIPTLVFGILPNVLLTPLHMSVTSLLYVVPIITPFQLTDIGSPALPLQKQETVNNTSIVASSPLASSSCFTKLNLDKKLTDEQFFEWLIGFIDAEGNFDIRKISNRPYAFEFRFRIGLHSYDTEVLVKIQNNLGMGSITHITIKNDKARSLRLEKKSTFIISKQEDVNKLIAILDKYGPLNTTKYLDFLSWKKAFLLYISSKEKSIIEKEIIKSEILTLKNNNNRGRTDFAMATINNIVIKPYWLLGFIEGEGCFSIQKHAKYLTIMSSFILTQTLEQKPVMVAIQTFLNNLEPLNSLDTKVKLIVQEKNIYIQKAKSTIRVYVTNYSFITNYLIPFLDSLVFSSIKELDYLDWKSVIKIKALKKHLTEEGSEVIKLTISRMNQNRKSTAFNNSSNELNFNLFNNNLD